MKISLGRLPFLLLLVIPVLSGCGTLEREVRPVSTQVPAEKEYGLYSIVEDTVWEGRIRVTGDVYVKEGATLTIKPGTVIRFDTIEPKLEEQGGRNMFSVDTPYFPGAEIIVKGRIIAVGTKDSPIVFTSSDKDAKPGSWGSINLLGSSGNIIEYCRISYAYNGIHNHASDAVVLNNVFTGNGTALSFKKADFDRPCRMFIEHNTITGNLSGIAARNATVDIAFNDISGNEYYGIWLREGDNARITYNDIERNGKGIYLYKAQPANISYNNIADNLEYNIAMAEDNPADMDAAWNWWGTVNPAEIQAKIFDRHQDESLGRVIFTPYLRDKVAGTVK